jgi:hypothetical protein
MVPEAFKNSFMTALAFFGKISINFNIFICAVLKNILKYLRSYEVKNKTISGPTKSTDLISRPKI